jgi:hypothetical protein
MQSVALYTVAGLILTAVGTLGVAPALIRGRIGKQAIWFAIPLVIGLAMLVLFLA